MTDGDLLRALAFVRAIDDRSHTRTEPHPWGVAMFNEQVPRAWSHNFLRVDPPAATATAGRLAEEADRLQGGAGLVHRSVVVDDEAAGARLAPGFEALGWQVERLLLMAWRRTPHRPARTQAVEELGWPAFRPVLEAATRRNHGGEEETIRQLVDRTVITAAATRLRHFAARADGRVASFCDLYDDGRTAQIESVTTFAEHQGRGLGSAVVLRAAEEATNAGQDLVFLMADDDDWPKVWYERLGFDPIGRTWTFNRPGPKRSAS